MDVNWSKTFVMIVKPLRKKIKIPDTIVVDSIEIKVVNKFKLLGVELQSELNFDSFVSRVCLQANRNMFSIKRLFFLSNNVKLHFFKTFCLPYFDYCLSICIYNSKTLLAKLNKSYYACLYRLLKFNQVSCSVSTVQSFLTRYGLTFSFLSSNCSLEYRHLPEITDIKLE